MQPEVSSCLIIMIFIVENGEFKGDNIRLILMYWLQSKD